MSLHGSCSGPTSRSSQALFYEIENPIKKATESTELVFKDIPPEIGGLLVEDIERFSYTRIINTLIMPTEVHDTHQDWVTLTKIQTSRKEPDLLLRHNTQDFPSFVIESGWTESLPMRLWLIGGQLEVQVVIVLRWSSLGPNSLPSDRIDQRHFRGMGAKFHRYSEAISLLRNCTLSIAQCILSRREILLGNMIPGSDLRWEHVISSGLVWFEKKTELDTRGYLVAPYILLWMLSRQSPSANTDHKNAKSYFAY
ncbi:hypothetical protein V8E54_011716 [Elaphomyces granulatus]